MSRAVNLLVTFECHPHDVPNLKSIASKHWGRRSVKHEEEMCECEAHVGIGCHDPVFKFLDDVATYAHVLVRGDDKNSGLLSWAMQVNYGDAPDFIRQLLDFWLELYDGVNPILAEYDRVLIISEGEGDGVAVGRQVYVQEGSLVCTGHAAPFTWGLP